MTFLNIMTLFWMYIMTLSAVVFDATFIHFYEFRLFCEKPERRTLDSTGEVLGSILTGATFLSLEFYFDVVNSSETNVAIIANAYTV